MKGLRSARFRRGRAGRTAGRRAVQDLVGTIIILAIAVVLAGIVTLWVNTYPIQTANRADLFSVNLTYGGSTCVLNCGGGRGSGQATYASSMNGINIELLAGPRITGASVSQSSVRLQSQQVPSAFSAPFSLGNGLAGSTSWSPGQTWSLNLTKYGLPYYDNLTVIVDSSNELVLNEVVPGPNPVSPPYFTSESVAPSSVAPGGTVNLSATLVAPDGLNTSTSPAEVYANFTEVNVGGANKPTAEIAVGTEPEGMTFDSSNGYVYVANYGSRSVSVINGSSNTVTATITVGTDPDAASYDAANGYIYVTNYGSNTVSVINTANDRVTSVNVGTEPDGVAFDSGTGYAYVANYGSNSVSVIRASSNTVTTTVTVGTKPSSAAYDAANGYVYVTNYGGSSVSVINGATNTVVTTVTVGSDPDGGAYDSTNGYVYITNYGGPSVSVIKGSTDAVVATITTGSEPTSASFDGSNGYVYVTDYGQANVTMINGSTDKVVGSVKVGTDPRGSTFDTSNQEVYTANYGSNNVTAITTSTLKIISLTYSASTGSWYATFTLPAGITAGKYYIFVTAVDDLGLSSEVAVEVIVT